MPSDFLSFSSIMSLSALIIACLVFIRAILFRRKNDLLKKEVNTLREKIVAANSELRELRHNYMASTEFQKNLHDAELITRLQQPRLSAQHGNKNSEAPERYLYVRSLAEKGMMPEEIASILSISTQEAEQLVNLSKLASLSSSSD